MDKVSVNIIFDFDNGIELSIIKDYPYRLNLEDIIPSSSFLNELPDSLIQLGQDLYEFKVYESIICYGENYSQICKCNVFRKLKKPYKIKNTPVKCTYYYFDGELMCKK